MKLSIITINLNNASGLIRTINSVVCQSSTDFEYIIIDGGSNDGSIEIIKSFTDLSPGLHKNKLSYSNKRSAIGKFDLNPIVYWISEPDKGIYHAMNKGILVASNDYVQFLNSGDTLANSDVIEKMLKLPPYKNILIGNMLKRFTDNRILRYKGIEKPTLFTFYRGTINHSSTFVKRDLFEKYGFFDERLQIVADWKWYLITVGLNNEQVHYRNIDVTLFDMTGISNTHSDLAKIERRKVLEEMLPLKILTDYDNYCDSINTILRLNNYWVTRKLLWLMERLLIKLDKWKMSRDKS